MHLTFKLSPEMLQPMTRCRCPICNKKSQWDMDTRFFANLHKQRIMSASRWRVDSFQLKTAAEAPRLPRTLYPLSPVKYIVRRCLLSQRLPGTRGHLRGKSPVKQHSNLPSLFDYNESLLRKVSWIRQIELPTTS